MMRKAAFLDRDGVINIDHAYVHKIEEFDWVPGVLEAARALSSQRDHVVACATRDKNRLRAVLLESCPALEAAVDLSDRRWLELLAGFGGA